MTAEDKEEIFKMMPKLGADIKCSLIFSYSTEQYHYAMAIIWERRRFERFTS